MRLNRRAFPSPVLHGRGVRGEGLQIDGPRFAARTLTPGPSPALRERGGRLETKSALSRAHVVAAARQWLGTPYLHQASAKGRGADCLGLIRGLYTELYGREPETPPPYTPDWNERRPCDEPLLSAARRHMREVSGTGNREPGTEFRRGPGIDNSQEDAALIDRTVTFATRAPAPGSRFPLSPGQVLIFRIVKTGPAKHCGIVSGEDLFIHAYAGRAVIESWLNRWWIERIAGVFDFPGVEE